MANGFNLADFASLAESGVLKPQADRMKAFDTAIAKKEDKKATELAKAATQTPVDVAAAEQMPQQKPEIDPMQKLLEKAMSQSGGPSKEHLAFLQQNRDKLLASLDEERKGLAGTESLIDKYAKAGVKGEVDLSPLLGLVDSWTGSNFSKFYQPPENQTAEERALDVAKLKTALAKAKGDLVKKEADIIKSYGQQLEGDKQDPFSQYMRLQALEQGKENARTRQERYDEKQRVDAENMISKEVGKIKEQVIDMNNQLDIADTALASGELGKITPVLATLARNLSGEKGVLTDRDINRILTNTLQMDAAKAKAYIASDPKAKLDPRVTSALRELIDLARTKNSAALKAKLKGRAELYNKRQTKAWKDVMGEGDFGQEALKDAEALFKSTADTGGGPVPTGPSASGWTDEKERRYQELKQKLGR